VAEEIDKVAPGDVCNAYERAPSRRRGEVSRPRSRSVHIPAPKATVMAGCAQCGGKFGLVRHDYARRQFCSKACITDFKATRKRRVDARLRQWWGQLCDQSPQPESPERISLTPHSS